MLPFVLAIAFAQAPSGATVFDNHCATCHAGSTDARVPTVAALRQRTPEAIVDALVSGVMRQQGGEITDADRRAVAEFLGTRSAVARRLPFDGAQGRHPSVANQCPSPAPLDLSKGPRWNGWGADLSNTRFQPASQAGLTAAQVPKLTLKWASGFPNATSARAQPTIAGGRLFGSQSGLVYALEAVSGCTIWTFQGQAAVRSAITIAPRGSGFAAYFGDGKANAYAVDAGTGTLLWTRNLGGMLYVNSGYGALGGRPGNVLLAFGLPDAGPPNAGADLLVRPKVPVPVAPAKPRDLEGVWSYATLTPFERPAELGEFFTAAQAEEFEAQTIGRNDRDRRDGGAATDAARGVADYWFDRGEHVASLNGKQRTSWVIDPPDGRVPALTPAARERQNARAADNREHPADGPEDRSLQERCLAFNAGPPIGLGPYNNFLQIFQSRDAVVIYTEMIPDARMVWTDGRPHAPPVFRRWLGDSRGRWEGSTLVVDTANFTGTNPFRGSGENLHLIERFTRIDAGTLLYEFTVDDPSTFTQPWTAQLPMTKSDERMFEYACHEGNYALPDILRGARFQEQQSK